MDRFGRAIDQRWVNASTGTATDRMSYTYDRNGNRLTKGNSVNTAFNEVYTYDGLNQLSSFNRGSGTRTQSWDYDALGNWDSITTNGTAQTRTANKQNEITSVSSATTPTYDSNGNMTGDENGKTLIYDAWNRLVAYKNGGTVLVSYKYDGLGRKVVENSGAPRDLYYSKDWQVLEEQVSGVTKDSYVWSPVYIDAMIVRDRPDVSDRQYVQHDANYNIIAILNTSGTVLERYVEDAFGKATFLDASWSTVGSSAYAWNYIHQGGRLDSTSGLVDFRYRQLTTFFGRWVSMDPIRFEAHDQNLYRAYNNSPICILDPSGTVIVFFHGHTGTSSGSSQSSGSEIGGTRSRCS